MKFGTFNFHAIPPHTNVYDVVQQGFDQALAAEANGFHSVWLPEHNGREYGLLGNAVVGAAAIAAATKRVRIATAVTRLPLHHPVHLAEDLAYVDVLSGGRVDWGVGKGYDQLEFGSYGVPFEEREQRWEETFDAVRHMWATRRTGYKSKHFDFADAELVPYPLQRPMIPTYVMVSKSDSSLVWAAERCLPVAIGSGPDWDDVKHKRELFHKTASAAGFSETEIKETLDQCWQMKQVHVSQTTERAIAEYKECVLWYTEALNNRAMFGFSGQGVETYENYMRHESVLVGSSEKVGDSLVKYQDYTGMKNIVCFFNIGGQPHAQVLSALHQFGADIISKLG